MPPGTKIHGNCDPEFSLLKEAFAEHFETGKELGAGVAVTLGGRSVVDLWGGYADPERTRPWEKDTLVNVYSTTKGRVTRVCRS
jgi:CubicO group peptidase (beta-lactamase class C family)